MKLKKVLIIFICFLVFVTFSNNVYASGKKAKLHIKTIDNISFTITQTDSFKLPATLKAKMSDGSNKSVNVKWDKYIDYNKVGMQYFKGTVAGYKSKVVLTLNIKNEADLNKIKKMGLYRFQLKDNIGEKYDVYIYQINSKMQVASYEDGTVWAGADEGDVLYNGIIKIEYSKIGSSEVNVVTHKSRYWEEEKVENQIVNMDRSLIKNIGNKYKDEPDILLIGNVLCSNASSIDIYYMYDGILKQTDKAIDTCGTYNPFFTQVDKNIFKTSSYDNAETFLFYIAKNKIDFATGKIDFIHEDKMTIEEYNDYIDESVDE